MNISKALLWARVVVVTLPLWSVHKMALRLVWLCLQIVPTCYGFYVLLTCYVEIPNSEVIWLAGGAFGKWRSWKQNSHAWDYLPHPSEMCAHSGNTAMYEPGSGFSPDTEPALTLVLDFPASRTVRNKCLLFKPLSSWHCCYNSSNELW
jgi:hypothetical protein